MDCGRARQLLWPPEQPRIADPAVVAAREHLEGCAACRAHFAIDGVLADMRDGLLGTVPSRQVRERVFQAVARERTDPGRVHRPAAHRRWQIALAALLIAGSVVAGVSGLILRRQQSLGAGSSFIEDYMRLAVREDHIATTDPIEVQQFILRELGANVEVLDVPGLSITGAEVCLLDGRRGAVVRYRVASGIVTYYLLPAEGIADRLPSSQDAARAGAPLVTWAKDGIERALIGPLAADSLLAVARRAN